MAKINFFYYHSGLFRQRGSSARQQLGVERVSHIFIFICVVNSLLSKVDCLGAWIGRSTGAVAKNSQIWLFNIQCSRSEQRLFMDMGFIFAY